MSDVLRTPDERFAGLPDFDFEPHHIVVDGLRIHLLDEGEREAAPILLFHGEPSWSYLYRRMVAPLVAGGHRVVVPDLVGFGRSDKPASPAAHTYAAHVGWMRALVVALDLHDITMFCQDWGGLIGLRVLAEEEERFRAVVAANTGLPTGEHDPGEAFRRWQHFATTTPTFDCGAIVALGTAAAPVPEVLAAYRAPFPRDEFLAGPRTMPALVPTTPDAPGAAENRAAWEVLRRFERPFVCAFSDADPITRGYDRPFRRFVPGAAGRDHPTIEGAGHFLQEDASPRLVEVVLSAAAAR